MWRHRSATGISKMAAKQTRGEEVKFSDDEEENVTFFQKCKCTADYKRLELKIVNMQKTIDKGKSDEVLSLEKKIDELIKENRNIKLQLEGRITELVEENKKLNMRLQDNEQKVQATAELEQEVKVIRNGWDVERQEIVDLKKVMEAQKKEIIKPSPKQDSKWVRDMLKSNSKLVRETVEQCRSIIIFGDREDPQKDRRVREKERADRMVKILKAMDDENKAWENEIEDIQKIGSYVKDGNVKPVRPTKIRFTSEKIVKEILARTWRLHGQMGYENIYVKKDLNEEERDRLVHLKREVEEENNKRTEQEKEEFFWRIKDMKRVKWWITKKD